MKVVINKNSWFMECGISKIPHSTHDSMRYCDQGPLIFKFDPANQSGAEYLPLMKVHSGFYGMYGLCDILNGRYTDQASLNGLFRMYKTEIVRSKPPTNPAVPIYVYLDKSDESVFVRELDPGVAFTLNDRGLRGRIFMKIRGVAGKRKSIAYPLGEHYNSISLTDGELCYVPPNMLVETVGYELVTV